MGMPHQKIQSCGKRHPWCKVCRPEVAIKTQSKGKPMMGVEDTEHLAPGYVPHPTKTMWERHRDAYNLTDTNPRDDMPRLDHRETPQPRLYFAAPKDLKPLEVVIEEVTETGRKFTYGELKHHFGFSKDMIHRFRDAERKETAYSPEKLAHLSKRREEREQRNTRIVSMRLDEQLTLKEIGEREGGLSRERVRQILISIESRHGIKIVLTDKEVRKNRMVLVSVPCKVCGLRKEVDEKAAHLWKKQFCDEHRMREVGYKYYVEHGVEWWKLTKQQRYNWKYHNDQRYRGVHIAAVKKWIKKIKADPIRKKHFNELQAKAAKRYTAKKDEAARQAQIRPFVEVPEHDDDAFVKNFFKLPRLDSNQEPPR